MRIHDSLLLMVLSLLPTGNGATDTAWNRDTVKVEATEPPLGDFYSKEVVCHGIVIRSSAVVSDEALLEAGNRLDRMLRKAPTVVANLTTEGAELHIIGKEQDTSDLPELRHWKGRPFDGDLTIDERTRGVGGLHSSCGEENLLGLKGDRYWDRDICTHEFAHTLHRFGLSEEGQAMVRKQFLESTGEGLWKGAYASTNEDEYFAELTMWYFGSRGDFTSLPEPRAGVDWLLSYDPKGHALMDGVYSGSLEMSERERAPLEPVSVDDVPDLRSLASVDRTTVVFFNRSSKTLHLHWVDHDGERVGYGLIGPAVVRSMQTFATHPWVLLDDSGVVVGAFVATARPGRAIVTVPSKR